MPKRNATAKVEDHGDAYEPVEGESISLGATAGEFPTTNPKAGEAGREYSASAIQEVITHPAGVHLTINRKKGVYSLRFDPQMPHDEFKQFLEEKIKPHLVEKHQIKDGPEIRFHWQPEPEKAWEIRFRYHQKDANGNDVLDEGGKPKWVSYHNSVQLIATRVADQAGRLLAEKLGVSKSAEIPF